MFIVYYKNDLNNGKIIRPTPFISISYNAIRNQEKTFGGTYSITLNGILLASAGSPRSNNNSAIDIINNIQSVGPNYTDNAQGNYTRVNKEIINFENRANSIFFKQQALRALFAHDGQKMEFSSIRNDSPILIFYPEVESISFDEGTYTDFCRYTINLTAPLLFDSAGNVLDLNSVSGSNRNLNQPLNYYIEDYSDTWSIEVDDATGRTPNSIPPGNSISNVIPRNYRVTRNISATGKTIYKNDERYEAWEQARGFIKTEILREPIGGQPSTQIGYFPGYLQDNTFGSGLLEIPNNFNAYNHVRSENIDKTTGSYSISDTWILCSDSAFESYDTSTSSSNESPIISISINGSIKGLSPNNADQYINNIKYINAFNKFQTITGDFGINSTIYKRARNITSIVLNPSPANFSMTKNELTGEINYNITYDNRPTNFFTGVSQESITITDTYPGDVYSIIPTINSTTGPIFQYIGGRTEYRRDLNIEFTVNRNNIGFNKMTQKASYIYRKPSHSPEISGTLIGIINNCSPASDPFIRKYFLNPTSESWDPKTGKYSTQISWTYELSK
jgi:hypothetical protein